MLLKEAGSLLGANERYFTAVYEAFKYKGDDVLRTYIDFIRREPVEWIRGFPLKLKTRASFSKPKAAIIKLLKTAEALEEFGTEYCSSAHDIVWDTFKKHSDDILNGRAEGGVSETNDLVEEPTVTAAAVATFEEVTDLSDTAATAAATEAVVTPWERKYIVLRSVVMSMLHDYKDNLGLVTAVHTLLATLEDTA